jgi:hypothetical protein
MHEDVCTAAHPRSRVRDRLSDRLRADCAHVDRDSGRHMDGYRVGCRLSAMDVDAGNFLSIWKNDAAR